MENTVLALKNEDYEKELNQFSTLVTGLADIISSQGIPATPGTPESQVKLATFTLEKLKKQNFDLLQHLAILESAILLRKKISNASMMKNVLDFMKFTAPKDFINSITEEDIVEIYNPEGIQIFRNLRFYETTTYSLTDLLTHEWYELYYRPSQITERLMAFAEQILKNPSNDIVFKMDDVPLHMIKEIKANPIQLCEIKFKNIAPVINRAGEKAGLIVNCQAKSMLSDLHHSGIDFI